VKRERPLQEDSRVALDPKEFSAVIKVRKDKTYPDLVNSLALRNLPKETAEAEGWPTFYMPEPCANGHTAARFVKNSLCVDCWRVRQGRETIYPTAKNRTYYKQRDTAPALTATGAPVVIAPPSPPEPSKVEQKFLAALDESRDFDTAAAAVNWARGLVESRASSNPVFKAALTDLCTRRDIPWTRAADPETYRWTTEIEKAFSRRYVDCGLIEQTRSELGNSASDYHAHIAASPSFASLIAAAEPLARITLRDRATKEAAAGNDRLLKILEVDEPTPLSGMTVDQINAEIEKLLAGFKAKGLFPTERQHKVTGEIINLDDYEYVKPDRSNANADLVSVVVVGNC
jgi:hypothetical protein